MFSFMHSWKVTYIITSGFSWDKCVHIVINKYFTLLYSNSQREEIITLADFLLYLYHNGGTCWCPILPNQSIPFFPTGPCSFLFESLWFLPNYYWKSERVPSHMTGFPQKLYMYTFSPYNKYCNIFVCERRNTTNWLI